MARQVPIPPGSKSSIIGQFGVVLAAQTPAFLWGKDEGRPFATVTPPTRYFPNLQNPIANPGPKSPPWAQQPPSYTSTNPTALGDPKIRESGVKTTARAPQGVG